MKEDLIIFEVFQAISHPDEYTIFARKTAPLKWVCGIILLLFFGVLQCLIWSITIIPTLINKWVLRWRYI